MFRAKSFHWHSISPSSFFVVSLASSRPPDLCEHEKTKFQILSEKNVNFSHWCDLFMILTANWTHLTKELFQVWFFLLSAGNKAKKCSGRWLLGQLELKLIFVQSCVENIFAWINFFIAFKILLIFLVNWMEKSNKFNFFICMHNLSTQDCTWHKKLSTGVCQNADKSHE